MSNLADVCAKLQQDIDELTARIGGLQADLDTARVRHAALAAGLRAAEDQLAEKGQLIARLLREREEFWTKLLDGDTPPPPPPTAPEHRS